mgnify:FL=1
MPREVIAVMGGPIDGEICTIHPKASEMGFFIHQDGDLLLGYFDHREKDRQGHRIFRPGAPPDAESPDAP